MLWWVIGLTALMGALDGLDGWLARRTGMTSEFGARFDMETDAGPHPGPVDPRLAAREGRCVGVALRSDAVRVRRGRMAAPWLARPLQSTWRGKTVAVGQLVGLSVALAPVVPVPLSASAAALALTALAWSFCH